MKGGITLTTGCTSPVQSKQGSVQETGCESSLETWLPEGSGMPAKSRTVLVVALPGSEMGFEMGMGGSRRRCLLERCYLQAADNSSVPIGSPSKRKIMLPFK